jgi:hypothetical protein
VGKGWVAKLGAVALVIAALAVGGCGGGSSKGPSSTAARTSVKPGVYVGGVARTNAYIALATNGTRLGGGYICDNNKLAVWVHSGSLEAGRATLVSRRGERLGEASFQGNGATGTVTINGAAHPYSIQIENGAAGLYRTTTGTPGKPGYRETGWIVLNDGTVKGITRFTSPIQTLETQPASGSPKGKTTSSFTDPTTHL